MIVTLPSGTVVALSEIVSFEFHRGRDATDARVDINLLSGKHISVHGTTALAVFNQINLAIAARQA
jgi:hypothetical protein